MRRMRKVLPVCLLLGVLLCSARAQQQEVDAGVEPAEPELEVGVGEAFDEIATGVDVESLGEEDDVNCEKPRRNEVVNIPKKFREFNDVWSPKVIGEMNDYQIKVVRIRGDFVWHDHPETDEAFFVIQGKMRIDLEGEDPVELGPGDVYVVPRGKSHKSYAEKMCNLMLIEPKGVINTGDADSDLTAPNDDWV